MTRTGRRFPVSISLSSGFSFQVASRHLQKSGRCLVSISLSSGFSFQGAARLSQVASLSSFNLVIERLLISGRITETERSRNSDVSISLSSGFSFQVKNLPMRYKPCQKFQSRYRAASHFRARLTEDSDEHVTCFNLVIERLLISGAPRPQPRSLATFLFQSRYRAASHFRNIPETSTAAYTGRFNLVIERLLISGQRKRTGARGAGSFNLVIERLLISGNSRLRVQCLPSKPFQSRYRAASHFRFRDVA